jgi:hypothetical protein
MNGDCHMSLDFWKNASPLVRRIMTIIITFIFAIIITAAGTLMPIEETEAKDISNELNQTVNLLITNNLLLPYIFGNNFMLTLIMFVPVAGLIFGGYVLYSTGFVIAADAVAKGYNPILVFLFLFLTPILWLEFMAYSTAMAESLWLARRLWQRRGKHEIINACKFISVCAVILLVSAVIETIMIYSVS